MRNLSPPREPPIELYDRIREAKQTGPVPRVLGRLRSRVLERYEAYARAAPRLEMLRPDSFSSTQLHALQHCYGSATQPLTEFRFAVQESLPEQIRRMCPLCGLSEHCTLEHYLPRSEFPEYSVCTYNLVPACSKCNTLKGTEWRRAGQGRRFLHLYYDSLPDDACWLRAALRIERDVPVLRFELQRPEGLDASLYALIESHYTALDLLRRFDGFASGLVSECLTLAKLQRLPPVGTRQLLRDLAAASAAVCGLNHWRAAGLLALAESDPFINLVCGAPPPPAQAA